MTMVVALFLAILMNKPLKGRVFFRSVLFFPYVASLVAIAVVWLALFNPEIGPINSILRTLGVENPPRMGCIYYMGNAVDYWSDSMEKHGILYDCLSCRTSGNF